MSFDGLIDDAERDARLVELHRAKAQLAKAQRERRQALQELAHAEERLDVALSLSDHSPQTSPIVSRENKSRHSACAVALLSDLHIEETVDRDAVCGENEYGPDIARARLRRAADGIVWLTRMCRTHFAVDDIVVGLLGDVISGYIHDELVESNAMSPVQATLWAHTELRAVIDHLLSELRPRSLRVLCCYGNHGRTTAKRRLQTGAANSYEWLLYHHLSEVYRGHPAVEFAIAGGPLLYQDVYGTTLRMTHGDTVRYGGGVGGISIPLNKQIARWDTHRRADITCLGHFHQRLSLPNAEVNGSLIGTSVYAQSFDAQTPCQSFFLIDEKRGRSMSAPIWVTP